MKIVSIIKSAIKSLWGEQSNCSKPNKKKLNIAFPVNIKVDNLSLTFWNIEQKYDPIPAVKFVIKDKDQAFKICEGTIFMTALSERILMKILDDPYVQGEMDKRRFYKN